MFYTFSTICFGFMPQKLTFVALLFIPSLVKWFKFILDSKRWNKSYFIFPLWIFWIEFSVIFYYYLFILRDYFHWGHPVMFSFPLNHSKISVWPIISNWGLSQVWSKWPKFVFRFLLLKLHFDSWIIQTSCLFRDMVWFVLSHEPTDVWSKV